LFKYSKIKGESPILNDSWEHKNSSLTCSF